MTAKTATKSTSKPAAAKKATTAKTTPAKTTAAKPAAKKATPAKTTAAKPAAKTAAKTTAPKPVVVKVDRLGEHIAEAFAKLPKGSFLKVSEIAAAKTKAFPKDDERPSSQTISGRCRDDRMPEGITGKTGPRGAVKR